MKTARILLAAMITTLSFSAFSQENVSAGPVVGVNFARFKGDINNTAWRVGPTVGAFLNYSIVEQFGLKGQITYTQLGTKFDNSADNHRFNYIQIPVLATVYLNKRGNDFRPKLMAGPYVGFLLNAKDQNNNDINVMESNGSRRYNSVDAGIQLGAGFNYLIGTKTWLNVDALYGHGLADITNTTATTVNNRQWGINVGLSFPLGKYVPSTGKFNSTR